MVGNPEHVRWFEDPEHIFFARATRTCLILAAAPDPYHFVPTNMSGCAKQRTCSGCPSCAAGAQVGEKSNDGVPKQTKTKKRQVIY